MVATPIPPPPSAPLFLNELAIASGTRALLKKHVDRALQYDPRDPSVPPIYVSDLVAELQHHCPSADTAPSLTQKVSKELRGLAAKAGGDVVTVTFKGRRRKALVCARSELPALRDVIANVR